MFKTQVCVKLHFDLHYNTLHRVEKHLPTPTVTLGFVIATLLGASFHLLLGGDVRRLALFLLSSWVGFGIGHLGGVLLNFRLLNIGGLRVLPALFGAIILLIFAHILSSRRQNTRPSR